MLGEIAHLDAGTERDGTLIRFGRAGDQLQQRRFAGAVNAHDAPALAALDQEIEAFIDGPAAIGLVDALDVDDVFARTRRLLEFEGDRLAALRRFDALDLVELFHAALYLRGMAGARLEALDELDFLGKHGLLAFELRLLLLFVLGALLFVKAVIAGIGVE